MKELDDVSTFIFALHRPGRQTNAFKEPSTLLNSETHWAPSNHHVSPLSDSVLRSVAHHPSAPPLPTPAPTPTTLSNALGIRAPVAHQNGPLSDNAFDPGLSSSFFDEFLSATLREMDATQTQTHPANHYIKHDNHSLLPQHHDHSDSPYPRVSGSPTAVGYSPSPAPSLVSTQEASQVSQIQSPLRPHQLTPRRTAYVSIPMAPPTPSRHRSQVPQESPDPLALRPGQTAAYLNVTNNTPSRKRKFGEQHAGPHRGVERMTPMTPMSKSGFPSARQRSVVSDATHNDADATAYDYGDGSDSDYGDTDADGDISGITPSTATASTRKGRKRGRLYVDRSGSISPGSVKGRSLQPPCLVVPLQKFTTLIEEIFEAEDSLAPDEDASLSQLPASFSAFFSPLTPDATRPLLNSSIMARLEQFIRQVARPPKRSRRQNMSSPVKPLQGDKGEIEPMSLSEIDPATLTRLLKLLERSVVLGEDITPFAGPAMSELPGYTTTFGSPSKKSKKGKGSAAGGPGTRRSRSRSRSRSHNGDGDAEGGADAHSKTEPAAAEHGVGTEPNEDDLEQLSTLLATAHDSVAAASCAISLLAADLLPKQVRLLANYRAPRGLEFTFSSQVIFRGANPGVRLYNQEPAVKCYLSFCRRSRRYSWSIHGAIWSCLILH